MNKEFADVINWLRSDEGEAWTRDYIQHGTHYGTMPSDPPGIPGFFTLKDDVKLGYSGCDLRWGRLPGDDMLRDRS